MHQPIPDKTQMRSDPLVGAQVGRYALLERIGDGPRGPVYRGKDADTGNEVAIKVLHEAASERELRAASSLGHPGIASVLDFGRLSDGRHYVVMELLKGEGLDWALRRGALSAAQTVRVLHEVTVTLSAAHGRSLFHGALRPASVFLTIDGHRVTGVKLLDFGVASDASELDDLFALGALAFAMLTGSAVAPPAPLAMPIAPNVPPELAALIEDLRKPEKLRPQTANEVRTRLGALLPPLPATEPPAPAAAAKPGPKPVPVRAIAVAAVGVTAIAAAALFFALRDAPPSEPPAPELAVPAPAPRPPEPAPAAVAPSAEAPEVVHRPPPSGSAEHEAASESRHLAKPASKAVPSEQVLEERMTRLESRLRKRPGNIDEGLFMLNKQRARLGGVVETDERRDIGHQLDLFEQAYLTR